MIPDTIGGPIMPIDGTARIARLMNVCDAIIDELQRQGAAEVMACRGFKLTEMAEAVIKAADGDVVTFRRYKS
jgi:hypothetical protein